MSFAVPSRAEDLEATVASLSDACKYKTSNLAPKATRAGVGLGGGMLGAVALANVISGFGMVGAIGFGIVSAMASHSASGQMIDGAEESGVDEATRFVDNHLAGKGDTLAILKSISTPTPKPLPSVVQRLKRLQSMLKESGEKEAATAEKRTSLEVPQSTFINWKRLLNDIESYL